MVLSDEWVKESFFKIFKYDDVKVYGKVYSNVPTVKVKVEFKKVKVIILYAKVQFFKYNCI